MFLKNILILFFVCLDLSSAVISTLNATEYDKLPPLYEMAPYEQCLAEENGQYCVVQFALVSHDYNPTMELIKEYSANILAHFNHSKLRHGICVSRTCTLYKNTSLERNQTLESCLNDTFYERYGLKTRLMNEICVNASNNPEENYEFVDILMLAVMSSILLINFMGTVYDVCSEEINDSIWAGIFISFSILRNWNRLRASAGDGPDPRIKRLRGINGLRALFIMCVIGSHSSISAVIFIDNPQFVESLFESSVTQILLNGAIIIQLFFIVSGLLLIYHLLVISEKHQTNWVVLPKMIILRWFRLTPPYALLILFNVSWIKYFGHGPAKHVAVTDEVVDCGKYWWTHLLYINNYVDDSLCVGQSWYLAADTQLYCFGLIVFLICKSPSRRKIVLPLLLIAGVIIPALVNYLYDLDGVLVMTPERVVQRFKVDPTFNYLYKRGHTNLFNYVVGLGMGYLVYYGQQKNINLDKYKKYRIIYLAIVPLCFAVMAIGIVMYSEGPRPSMVVRMLLAAFVKPMFGVLIAALLYGIIFKYENVYRSFFEWSIWTSLARLSYSAYLLHITILRITLSGQTTTAHVNTISMCQQSIFLLCLSFLVSVPLYLMVEQPFGQLLKVFFTARTKDEK